MKRVHKFIIPEYIQGYVGYERGKLIDEIGHLKNIMPSLQNDARLQYTVTCLEIHRQRVAYQKTKRIIKAATN